MLEEISRSWSVRRPATALLLALTPSRASIAAEPGTYGTSTVSYARVPGLAFFPERSEYGYVSSGFPWQ